MNGTDDAIETLVPGSRLDRYELLCPLAKGGMASVWIARQTGKHGFEKLVAIKTILPQFSSDHRFQRMFLDEAHIAAGIEHPNVAQILDLGEQHDVLYIVMEYVDGDALSRLERAAEKRGVPIPTGIMLRVLADACAGLHAAHELRGRDGELLNVVHRDVSPQNVLVGVKGVSKIIDFGVAKARDRVADETNAGVLKGKIAFMAPEQAMGRPIDRRSDVWAIGAMLYQHLAGRPAYDGENQLVILHKLTSGRPPLPLPQSVPRPLNDLVRSILVQDPAARVADANVLHNALEEVMVTTGLRASHVDVAAFMAAHMSDRAAVRKNAIDMALSAAAERSRMASLLSAAAPHESASGVSRIVGSSPGVPSSPGVSSSSGVTSGSIASIRELVSAEPEPATTAGVPASLPYGPSSAHSSSGATAPVASAPVAAAPVKGSGSRLPLVVGGVAAALVIAAVAVLGTRSRPVPPPASAGPAKPLPAVPSPAASPSTAPAQAAPTASAEPAASVAPTASAEPSASSAKAPTTAATGIAVKPKATAASTAPTAPTTKPKSKTVDDGF